jgi:hypothetical protein
MKTRKLIRKLYKAILRQNILKESKLYRKLLKKSFKGKNTMAVK